MVYNFYVTMSHTKGVSRQELDGKEEALAGLNEMIRMGWRCSTELYAEMVTAVK